MKTILLAALLVVIAILILVAVLLTRKSNKSEDVLFSFSNTEFLKLRERKDQRAKIIAKVCIALAVILGVGIAFVLFFYATI